MSIIQTYWLRKVGTSQVFLRTAILAKRADMEAVSEAKAKELLAQQQVDGVARRQRKTREAVFGPAAAAAKNQTPLAPLATNPNVPPTAPPGEDAIPIVLKRLLIT